MLLIWKYVIFFFVCLFVKRKSFFWHYCEVSILNQISARDTWERRKTNGHMTTNITPYSIYLSTDVKFMSIPNCFNCQNCQFCSLCLKMSQKTYQKVSHRSAVNWRSTFTKVNIPCHRYSGKYFWLFLKNVCPEMFITLFQKVFYIENYLIICNNYPQKIR